MASASKDRIINVIQNLMKEDIKYIAPIHCSGENFRNIMDKNYHQYYLKLHVGSKILITSTSISIKN